MAPPEIPIVARAQAHRDRTAIIDRDGAFTYQHLFDASARIAGALLGDRGDLDGERVAFLVPPGFAYAATQWGIWRAGGIAVPLCITHPPPELARVLDDCTPAALVAHPELEGAAAALAHERGIRLLGTADALAAPLAPHIPSVAPSRPAMIVYTSGTSGTPKGAVTTHANIAAQVQCLVQAWGWNRDDRILLTLPLHHVHGIVNVLACALWSGACCDMLPRFDAERVWARLREGGTTLFMAVPTIYRRLVTAWEAAPPDDQREMSDACASLRLMVSGSAALPVATFNRWKEITGHALLERYGMTEIGMALSNPLDGDRVPGTVGSPLPDVDVRVVGDDGVDVGPGEPGELLVRGPNVFLEYWNRPDETRAAVRDGWFLTGDVAVVDHGRYRILGRKSADIIKTGGFKVSALEIEEVLREHPSIAECAVVGVEDPEWGERICVAVEGRVGYGITLDELRLWAKDRLAPYKIPRSLHLVDVLPRNAMGKVVKADVATLFV